MRTRTLIPERASRSETRARRRESSPVERNRSRSRTGYCSAGNKSGRFTPSRARAGKGIEREKRRVVNRRREMVGEDGEMEHVGGAVDDEDKGRIDRENAGW